MGLGTEIGRALLGLAFERLRAERVWCKVMVPNSASARLARRIGMKHLRSHPDYQAGHGRHTPVEFYTMAVEDYFDLTYYALASPAIAAGGDIVQARHQPVDAVRAPKRRWRRRGPCP